MLKNIPSGYQIERLIYSFFSAAYEGLMDFYVELLSVATF